MSTFEEVTTFPAHTHEGAANPTQSVVGAKVDDLWLNTVSGEQFRCHVQTFGSQEWLGSQGNTVAQAAILSPTHPNLSLMYTMDSEDIIGSTVVDLSSGSRDGTVIGSPTSTTGVLGDAMGIETISTLNDRGIYVPATDFGTGVDGSAISLWFYKPGNWTLGITSYYLVNRGSIYARSAGLLALNVYPRSIDGSIRYRFYAHGGAVTSDAIAEFIDYGGGTRYVDQWVHCVGTYDPNGELAIYLNGEKMTSLQDRSGDIISNLNSSASWSGTTIGYANVVNDGSESRTWVGSIDQLRIFNRGLLPEEITALYNEGTP